MRIIKPILAVLSFILGAGVCVALVWGLLYLCVPPVKDKTDEMFNKTQIE